MRNSARAALAGLVAAIVLLSCGEGADEGAGSGGSGGAAGSSGGSGGTGPFGSCFGACGSFTAQGCQCDVECEANGDCCDDYAAECKDKVVPLPAGCVTLANFFPLCNPITNEGCQTNKGEACDFTKGGLECWKENNTEPRGASCAGTSTKYCVPTYTCSGSVDGSAGVCKRFCCSDADCGGGACKAFDENLGTLGACESLGDAGADASDDADAAGDAEQESGSDAADGGDGDGDADASGSDAAGDAQEAGVD